MKVQIFVVFSVIILFKIISICDGSCFTECADVLPKRIQQWKRKDYGLEIPGPTTIDPNLKGDDLVTQKAAEDGRLITMYQVNKLIRSNNQGNPKKYPDFVINKLDPISYGYNGMPMLITFSNIELRNLDGYAYDLDSAQYSQTGVYQKGSLQIDQRIYDDLEKKKRGKKSDKVVEEFLGRINKNDDGEYILERRDCKWTIQIGARFVTHQNNVDKPIRIKAKFKIQPDTRKNIDNQETGTNEDPLKAEGVVEIEFHDFKFNLSLDITHIDDPLRPYLNSDKKTDNLVPDFDITYSMTAIEIIDIKLLKYGKDDDFPEKPDNEEEVNQNLPPEEDLKNKIKKDPMPVDKNLKFITNDSLKSDVKLHLNVLKKLIIDNQAEIKKKLCANLLPKMAYKIMHMETKKQLPSLFYEIIAYEDDFQEKRKLPPFKIKDWINLMKNYAAAKTIDTATKWAGKLSGPWFRSQSAPASMTSASTQGVSS